MKIFIVICLIAYASALDCSEGQATWCSSLRAAKECGAVNHCKDTVWKNLELTQDASDLCTFCESVVTDVQNMLNNKQAQAEIKNFLDSACSVIPDADMQKECEDVVNNDLPELLMLLSEELDPSLVCGALGLCNNAAIFMRAPKVEKTTVKKLAATGDICADCKTFMGDIKAEITSNTTESELEDMLDNFFCAQLGQLEETCKNLVAEYVPELLQMLASETDPTMECEAMGFCPASSTLAKLMIPKLRLKKSPLYSVCAKSGDSEFCETCKTAINTAKTMATNPDIESEIEDVIDEELCSQLGQYSTVCSDTVKQYLAEIMQLLASELDADADCEALGLCTAEENPLNSLLQSKITDEDIKAMQESFPRMHRVSASGECVICEFIMNQIDRMLEQNATEQQIIKALDGVCSILPSTISDECTDFVNQYGPAVLALLLQEMEPSVICSTLGLCSSAVLEQRVEGGEYCSVCELIVQYADSLLSENATESDIEKVLDKVCNFLPDAIKSECNDVVSMYTPMLVQLLQKELSPTEICTELKLCTGAKEKQPEKQQQLLGESECTWGPAYWCASKENAAKCGAEAHCMKHVWN